jgi:hypothetical protein
LKDTTLEMQLEFITARASDLSFSFSQAHPDPIRRDPPIPFASWAASC